ncbi:MSHA biogenesis protein MshE [Enterovibrio norvegicus]|uniref:GspE/PulE family protein n=1 Tax=Enterovibrio norvegicus TaxID=188144 RepID=UPI000C81DB06|nr:GspE/PulE family protein [Enterovibrio norvegicus]MCC4799512.1 Flp pilus assembly complex ATPase component TadA [Enterovibrio norvegicus]PMI31583.1 MSHA biogenesis protein MshE [Enterovibrio norvegicus]PMI36783.1 MSHA biogenesis protein MshE [Enterovibrio norvegicus]PMN50224.1 MSHA biogenesis protein MshE [Enterovibrio norvegicus]TKF16923.1 MSHA biogenesis protein MshE [Enterovibrio norvegicus]
MAVKLRKRLGDLLVEEQIISDHDLSAALQRQSQTGRKLGDTLMDMGILSEHQLLDFLARQLNVPLIDLSLTQVDPSAVTLLPEVHARRLRALVIGRVDDTVRVAMSDPADLAAQESVLNLLHQYRVELLIVAEQPLVDAFDRYYRRTSDIASFAERLQAEHGVKLEQHFGAEDDQSEEVTVVKLINSLFEDAVQVNASDIHIEPDADALRIRQRIDGILHETLLKERAIASALVLRLKLMSGMDISEKRLPQDGRFNINVRGNAIDVRVSTLPVQHGESVVMRLLNQSAGVLSLTQVGMDPVMLQRFRNQLRRPHGMILVTGPTGSGKTTTLYGALNELNVPGKKILTAEDPVEYRLPRINQVQIANKIGLTFSSALRTFLRQDPDIILVGEMRDLETVEIGLRASLTGHLVLSTLHTNNAIDSALRLLDMEAPGYLVASAVRAVLAQRLIRRICPDCKVPHALNESESLWLTTTMPESANAGFYVGRGCQHCNFTGYKGRIGVFELLEITPDLMDALRANDTRAFALLAEQQPGYKPLVNCALDYAKQGSTTLEETMKLSEGAAMSLVSA